ncbi:MAG: alpha-glucan family phosphorylase [Planctomycetota bacterium]
MSSNPALFEVSFEVCNKVGGIHTVLSTKASTLVERYGDDYICVGPWLLRDEERQPVPFLPEGGPESPFADFEASCRDLGCPVRVGRWDIPGRPRVVLVDFSNQYEKKDGVLAGLWETYRVDSLQGTWDYIEPVLFGDAAGKVIQRWWEEFHAPHHRRAVAQFHEWMTAAGLLHLKRHCPGIGTVFTTHATMLGRALSSLGRSPEDGLGDDTVEELATDNGVAAKHSLEVATAREADVFTTVSEITADEAALVLGRRAAPVLPNGIDLAVVDALAGTTPRADVRTKLARFAGAFLGEEVSDAAFLAISGRYEFHNKGIDLALDALADVAAAKGRRVVLFVLVPAGNSGPRPELRDRLARSGEPHDGPLGVATHQLFNAADDDVQKRCAELHLDNSLGSRVKVVHVPVYLGPHDGFLDEPYEAIARAMDLTLFPSYYEPWGYTPQESLALGVPTISSDYAGFGRWARKEGLKAADGVTVISRARRQYDAARAELAGTIEAFLREAPGRDELAEACRRTASRTAWRDLITNYEAAFSAATDAIQKRMEAGVPLVRRAKQKLVARAESRAPRLTRFDVSATLPDELAPLAEVARNYAWCWDPEGRDLFRDLSRHSWDAAGHNPIVFLRNVFRQDLEAKAKDTAYVARLGRVVARLRRYLAEAPGTGPGSGAGDAPIHPGRPVAYFSAEYGIHESLRVYSGGLGILSGDHLKSASDVGLPLVAVGLYYRKGYMRQRLTADGEQLALDLDNEPRDLPVEPVLGANGAPLEVRLALPGRELALRAWRVPVGRVSLFLLDADVPSNRDEDREITRNLYGGDETTRIKQEIVLGRGGARMLAAMGIEPACWHMNEGHAAFMALERVSRLVRDESLTFEEAREIVRATTAFTTHTPVPAGHDRFHESLVRTYFADVADWLGVPWERFWGLGQPTEAKEDERALFNMTCLAMQFASYVNGVAKIHGEVSKGLLHSSWPGLLEGEVPINSITNGVHLPTWIRTSVAALVGVTDRPVRGADFVEHAKKIDVARLWAVRHEAKLEMLQQLRGNLKRSFVERDDSPVLLARMLDGIDEDALWIGFARRFAPYKRAHLLFSDKERLRRILESTGRPVRIVVSGKAHPRDGRGKEIVQEIARLSRSPEFAGRVFIAEDYDVALARALVQGVDVWLNTPTRPLEASGTSGMKAAANGGLNLSIGDGWWPEGWDGDNGWMIGDGRVYQNQALQDQLDSETLYRLLEEEVVPLYYDRDAAGVPRGWAERSRHALETLPMVFDTDRMVLEYAREAYRPLAKAGVEVSADRGRVARERAARKARLRELLPKVKVVDARLGELVDVKVGDAVVAHITLDLGQLAREDLEVELVLGHEKGDGDLVAPNLVRLRCTGGPDSAAIFEGSQVVDRSGGYAYGLRMRPSARFGDASDLLRDMVRWIG